MGDWDPVILKQEEEDDWEPVVIEPEPVNEWEPVIIPGTAGEAQEAPASPLQEWATPGVPESAKEAPSEQAEEDLERTRTVEITGFGEVDVPRVPKALQDMGPELMRIRATLGEEKAAEIEAPFYIAELFNLSLEEARQQAGTFRVLSEAKDYRSFTELLGDYYRRGQYNFAMSQIGERQRAEAMVGNYENIETYNDQIRQLAQDMPAEMPEGTDWYKRIFIKAAEMLPMQVEAARAAAPAFIGGATGGAAAAAIAGQLGPQIALPEELVTVPGAALAGGMAAGKAMYTTSLIKQMTGYSMIEMINDGSDPSVASWVSLAKGTAQGLLESAQFSKIVNLVPGKAKGIGLILQNATSKFLKGTGGKVAKGLTRAAGTYTQEMMEEVAQDLVGAFGDDIAAATEQYLLGKDVDYNTTQEILEGVKQTISESAEPILGMMIAPSVIGTVADVLSPEAQAAMEPEAVVEAETEAEPETPPEVDTGQLGYIADTVPETPVTPESIPIDEQITDDTPVERAQIIATEELQTDLSDMQFETADEFIAFAKAMYDEDQLPNDAALLQMYGEAAPGAAEPTVENIVSVRNTEQAMTASQDIASYGQVKLLDIERVGKVYPILVVDSTTRDIAINPDTHQIVVSWDKRSKQELNSRFFRLLDDIFSPLPEDTFVRVTKTREDYQFLQSGGHKGSKNWATGEAENGLSVSRSPEFPGEYAYYVKGKVIGQGTDGEPLLDITSAKPVSELFVYDDLYDDFKQQQKEYVKRFGLSDLEWRTLQSQRQFIWDADEYIKQVYGEQTPAGDITVEAAGERAASAMTEEEKAAAILKGQEPQATPEQREDLGLTARGESQAIAPTQEDFEAEAAGRVLEPQMVEPEKETMKARVRRITGQTTMSRMITEEAALQAAIKKEEQGARKGYSAGKKVGKAEESARLKTLRERQKAIQEQKQRIRNIRKDIEKVQKKATKMDPVYKNEIQRLTDGIDMVMSRRKSTLTRLEKTAQFLRDNPEHDLPDYVMDNLAILNKTRFGDLTVDQMEQLHDAVMTAAALNERKQTIRANLKAMDREKAINSTVQEIGPGKRKARKFKGEKELSGVQKAARWVKDTAQLGELRPDVVATSSMGDGIGYDVLVRQVEEKMSDYYGYKQKTNANFKAALDKNGYDVKKDASKWITERVVTNGWRLERGQRVALYLHSLDEDNRESILQGGVGFRHDEYRNVPQKMSEADFNAIIESLTPEEMAWAKAAQETFKQTGKDLSEEFLRLNWYEPEMRDNYMRKSVMPAARAGAGDVETESFREQAKQRNFRIGVKKGMLKERQDVRLPIYLDNIAEVLNESIEDAAAYVNLEDVLQNAHSLLYDRGVRAAFAQHKGGDAVWRYMDKYLQDVAGAPKTYGELSGSLQKLSAGITKYALGLNFSVALKQMFSLPFAMLYENPKDLFMGTMDELIHPRKSQDLHRENSARFVEREKGYSWDWAQAMEKNSAAQEQLNKRQGVRTALFAPTKWVDKKTVSAVMNGAVRQALKEFGDNKVSAEVRKAIGDAKIPEDPGAQLKLAYKYADYVVGRSQPTFSVEQLSAMQRGGDFEKLWTKFSSFTNQELNMLYRATEDAKKGNYRKLAAFSMAFVGNALAVLAVNNARDRLRGKEPDKEPPEQVKDALIDAYFGMHYVLRDIESAVMYEKDTVSLPAFRIFEELVTAGTALYDLSADVPPRKKEAAGRKFAEASLNMVMMRFGIPYSVVGRTVRRGFEAME